MKNLIKILTVILLGLSLTGCELFDPREWQKATEYRRERGIHCYERRNGNVRCEDKDGNDVTYRM